jgi:hypothetical protein
MRRAADWTGIGLTLALFGAACSSQQSLPPPGASGGASGVGGTGGAIIETETGGTTGSGGQDGGPGLDATFCCPHDPIPVARPAIGSLYTGGPSVNGQCYVTYDFWCDTNWRVETDMYGCSVLRWDNDPTCHIPGLDADGSAGRDGGPGPDAVGPDAVGPDAVVCCPPDPQPTGCTNLGGASLTGQCYTSCDFFGSSRWRIENDAYGCPVWRYDVTGGCSPDSAAPKMCFDGGLP